MILSPRPSPLAPRLIAADLFCGLGGFTTGAEQSGLCEVKLAVNHWRPAAYCFGANHPGARVICARIDDVDPRNDRTLPAVDVLLASPECTHHSNARGGQPVEDQKRATPWHVVIWTECKRPQWVIVENVQEFRTWGPLIQKRDVRGRPLVRRDGRPWMVPDPRRRGDIFRQWIRSLESLGYTVDHQVLCAADFGVATTRRRLFIVAKRDDVLPGRDIPWPEPTHSQNQWRPAASIIDWHKPCPSIFGRPRPLAEKTLRRIEIGLRKFVGPAAEPFIVKLYGNSTVAGTGEPLGTVTAQSGHLGLAMPFLTKYHGDHGAKEDGSERSHDVCEPLPTIDTQNRFGLAMPFFLPRVGFHDYDGPKRSRSVEEPVPTIIASHPPGHLVMPYLVDCNHGGDKRGHRVYDPRTPLGTLTSHNGKGLVTAFLTKYYGTGGAASVLAPLDTVTAKSRFGLALVRTMAELGVFDVGHRMLQPDELLAAQGFPAGYSLDGARTKAEQTKLIGNAVPPAFSHHICRAISEAAP